MNIGVEASNQTAFVFPHLRPDQAGFGNENAPQARP